MGFHTDFDFVIEHNPALGDFVAFRKGASASPLLPRGATALLDFPTIAGDVEIEVSVLDSREPSRIKQVGVADPIEIEQWNRLPFTVELRKPGVGVVMSERVDVAGWRREEGEVFRYTVPSPMPKVESWECAVTNRGRVQATVYVGVTSVVHRVPKRVSPIAVTLLNHAYQLILVALTPSASVRGRRIEWSFGEELRHYFGDGVPALGRQVLTLPEGTSATGRLESFALRARAGFDLLAAVDQRWEKRNAEVAKMAPVPRAAFEHENNEFKRLWHDRVRSTQPVIHLQVAFTDIEWSYEVDLWIRDLRTSGRLEDVLVDVFIAFNSSLTGGHVLVFSPARFEGGVLELAEDLGIIDELGRLLENFLPSAIAPALPFIGQYLGDALGRLLLKDAMCMHVLADGSDWRVTYALQPPTPGGGRGSVTPAGGGVLGDVGGVVDPTGGGGGVRAVRGGGDGEEGGEFDPTRGEEGGEFDPTRGEEGGEFDPTGGEGGVLGDVGGIGGGVLHPTGGEGGVLGDVGGVVDPTGGGGGAVPGPAPMPPEFVVHEPETLSHLDQIETIVVVMMENRSFDHMLGFLRQLSGGERYEGLSLDETNSVATRQEPVPVSPARDVLRGVRDKHGRPVAPTAIQVSPQHDMKNVLDQIAGGTMSGFAQDVEERQAGAADVVMSYYTDRELLTYYALARDFAVCDHWFAAHPGGTWPNRWATLTGRTPMLVNPDIDDPNLAYQRSSTIFSWLSTYKIEWRVFESDLSIIRTFNSHRIDSTRVLPLPPKPSDGIGLGEGTSFWDLAARGALPPVVFVEPNFSDLPPLATANDDLAPVDLRKGQRFVAEIVDALTASPQWARTLLVITYDEHGGFYDHVAPPGTPAGPPEWIGKVPKIHRQGAEHLGVRVPALVVSPFVSAGSAKHTVLDHTSIVKTILLRHRAKFNTHVFKSFGERVNQSAHLGQVLDLDTPRGQRFGRYADAWVTPRSLLPRAGRSGSQRLTLGSSDVEATLRSAFLPRRR